MPRVAESAYVAPEATLEGDVELGDLSSVWPGAVLRGDINGVTIGDESNVQDNVVIHVTSGDPAEVGEGVTVGHGAVVEGAQVGDGSLVGMNSTVMGGTVLGKGCLVAAGAVVTEGFEAEAESLLAGVPAKRIGDVSEEQRGEMDENRREYVEMARRRNKE